MEIPPSSFHKFDQPLKKPLTYRERTELQYSAHFIPFLKFLEKAIGHEQVIEYLQEMAFQGIKEYAEEILTAAGKNDLSVIKEIFSPENPNFSGTLTMQVLESTENTYVVDVTECLLAQVFRQADAADYGSAYLCCDVLFTQLINPDIALDLGKTLMDGSPSCLHRWHVKQ
jgi:hypothetical protein